LLPKSDFIQFIADSWKKDEGYREEKFPDYVKKMVYYLTVIHENLTVIRNIARFDQKFDPPFVKELAEVLPYLTPLNKMDNKVQWWTQHRSLFLQTAALGPIGTINNGIEEPRGERLVDYILFDGCRKITIKNNVIPSIEIVLIMKFEVLDHVYVL
jgi:hypothetical protein